MIQPKISSPIREAKRYQLDVELDREYQVLVDKVFTEAGRTYEIVQISFKDTTENGEIFRIVGGGDLYEYVSKTILNYCNKIGLGNEVKEGGEQ